MIKKILQDSTVYGLMGIFSAFTGTFVTPIYTRIFSSAEYAILDFLIATLVILSVGCGVWIDTGIARNYYLAKKSGDQSTIIGTGLLLCFLSSTIFAVAAGLIYHFWFQGFAGTTWGMLLPLLIVVIPRRIQAYSMQILRLEHQPKPFLIIAVGQILSSTILSIVMGNRIGVAGVMWAFAIARIIFAFVGIFTLRSKLSYIGKDGVRFAKEAFSFGVPLVPTYLSQWVQNYAGRIILIAALSLTQVGHFSLGLKIASFASIFLLAFNQAWIPYYNEMLDSMDGLERYPRMLNFYLIGMLLVSIGIGSFSTVLVSIFGTQEYLPAVGIVSFIAMGLIWDGSLKIVDAGISKMRKTKWTTLAVSLGWAIYFITLSSLVTRFGIQAAGISYLIASVCTAMLVLTFSQKFCKMPYDYVLIVGVILASIGLSIFNNLVLPASAYTVSDLVTKTTISLVVSAIIWAILCCRLIFHEDLDSLKAIATRFVPSLLSKSVKPS